MAHTPTRSNPSAATRSPCSRQLLPATRCFVHASPSLFYRALDTSTRPASCDCRKGCLVGGDSRETFPSLFVAFSHLSSPGWKPSLRSPGCSGVGTCDALSRCDRLQGGVLSDSLSIGLIRALATTWGNTRLLNSFVPSELELVRGSRSSRKKSRST